MDNVAKLFIGIVGSCCVFTLIFSDNLFIFIGMFYVLCMIWTELRCSHKQDSTKEKISDGDEIKWK